MQRATKYRLTIAALGLGLIGLAIYAVTLQQDQTRLRDQAAQDMHHVSESEKRLTQAQRVIDRLKSEASGHAAAQSTMQQAVAAFSRQAEACQAIKQQFHVQD